MNKKMIAPLKYCALIILTLIIISCNDQSRSESSRQETVSTPTEQQETKETRVIKTENSFNCGFLDSEGNLWFGTIGNGIYRYDGTSFAHFTENDGLSNNQVWAITENKEGNLWFGTAKGLSRYDRKTFTTIAIPQQDTSSVWLDKVYPVVNPNQIMSLLQDKNGMFWIGTNGSGAYRYDGQTFTQYLSNVGDVYEDSLHHNIVLSITEDKTGNIWFTSLSHGGVSRYDGNTFTHFMPEDGLSDDMIRTSYMDSSGNIWFGFNGNRNSGLTYYNGKTFSTYAKADGLINTNTRAICEDKNGHLWLGSNRGNVCVFDGKSFAEFTTKDGQRLSGILFIIEDGKENIWLGGKDGLWMFDGNTLTDMTL